MQQGIDIREIDQMAVPQAQGIESLGTMEDASMIPNGGIQGAVPEAAEMLAAAGREGDIYIIHASEGDTVIPEDVLAGPGGAQIREMLFRQMEQMGVDPQRYVVGNELNSINPETGLPEFFFKKLFKKIKKFFKKVAPIILPVAFSMVPFLGPILGSAIGSGIGSLIQGGSAKDALKAAAFGGITAGIMSGVGGMMSGAGAAGAPGMTGANFMAGVGEGLPVFEGSPGVSTYDRIFGPKPDQTAAAGTSFKRLAGTPSSGATSGASLVAAQPSQGVLRPADSNALIRQRFNAAITPTQVPSNTADALRPQFAPPPRPVQVRPGALKQYQLTQTPSYQLQQAGGQPSALNRPPLPDAQAMLDATLKPVPKAPGFLGQTANVISGSPSGAENALLYNQELRSAFSKFSQVGGLSTNEIMKKAEAVARQAVADAQPGTIRKWGPGLLAAYALASATGLTEAEKEKEPVSDWERNPIWSTDPYRLNLASYDPRDKIGLTPYPTQAAAHGGEMQNFPPRTGAISGPGTGRSDDVPAMLSDGEFVMTAQAVRGAGNGSRRQGVRNLYDLMRNFEGTA
jgi:hypothetical protein